MFKKILFALFLFFGVFVGNAFASNRIVYYNIPNDVTDATLSSFNA